MTASLGCWAALPCGAAIGTEAVRKAARMVPAAVRITVSCEGIVISTKTVLRVDVQAPFGRFNNIADVRASANAHLIGAPELEDLGEAAGHGRNRPFLIRTGSRHHCGQMMRNPYHLLSRTEVYRNPWIAVREDRVTRE